MATEKQVELINKLAEENGIVIEELGWTEEMFQHDKYGKGRASLAIKELFGLKDNK